MLQLLIAQRDTLRIGDLIPCGDLWDQVAHGEEAFSDVMRASFENAKRLYHNRLLPVLEEEHKVSLEHDRPRAADPEVARRLQRFDNDDRLVKTLLLSALVPEVEALKNLTASRLAALNHGTIKTPPGTDAARVVLNKVRGWAGRVGEIRVGDGLDPVISVRQRSALEGALRLAPNAAYRIAREPQPGTLDATHEPAFRSLDRGLAPQVPVGADLGQALEHLLSQALAQQFPDHPHFEREVRRSDCEKVLEEVRKAARAEDGRVQVDKAVRPVVKLVVNALGLGHVGEQYLALEKTWQGHFNRQLAAGGMTEPTARDLRAWTDLPRARGLAPEVGSLLILAFAEQTNRSFHRPDGRHYEPALDDLPDDLVLRPQPLPPEFDWEEAVRRAREVFGVTGLETSLRTASNVAALAAKLADKAVARDACHGLVHEVKQALSRLGLTDEQVAQAPRYRTARAVDTLLAGLLGDATPALEHLSRAKLDTSGPPMSTSLEHSAGVLRALRGTS